MKQLLILEPLENFQQKLVEALRAAGKYGLTVTENFQDGLLGLAEKRHDLALLPAELAISTSLISDMRQVQPDLRVVLLTSGQSTEELGAALVQSQGALLRQQLSQDLDNVLAAALKKNVQLESLDEHSALDSDVVMPFLQQLEIGENIQTMMLAHPSGVIALRGELTLAQATAIALLVRRTWADASYPVQIQFFHIPGQTGDWLIFSRAINDTYVVILVAWPHAAVSLLRAQAEELVYALGHLVAGKFEVEQAAMLQIAGNSPRDSKTYAMVWRPIDRLPGFMHIPVRRTLERIAQGDACIIRSLAVTSELVHMVVTCPPGRNTIWVAHVFKSGSETEIREQFGVKATLWAKGYYATESSEPLSEAELNLFLERSQAEAVTE